MKHIFTTLLISFLSYISIAQNAVKFADSDLEQAIRSELEIPFDSIYPSDMLLLTKLETGNDIDDLDGLKYASNIERLVISRGYINDLSELSGLTNLKYLYIYNNYKTITDLSPLSTINGIKHLSLIGCFDQSVTSINVLSTFSQLEKLDLSGNEISDISVLSTLTGLDTLDLSVNKLDRDDLTDLYGLTNLKPPLDLRNNGKGFPDDAITALAVRLPNISLLEPNTSFILSSHIYWNSLDVYIDLASGVRFKAETVDTIAPNKYEMSGYVSIEKEISTDSWFKYLSFSSPVLVDKSISLAYPEFSGSGTIYAFGNTMTAGTFKYQYNGGFKALQSGSVAGDLYGFPLKSGAISFQDIYQFQYIHQEVALQDMPFPLDKIFDYVVKSVDADGLYSFGSVGVTKSYKYDKNSGSNDISYTCNIVLDRGYNFGAFAISELELSYNQAEEKMGGSFKIKIPGYASGDNLGKSTLKSACVPVEVRDEKGNVIGTTDLNNFADVAKAWQLQFLEFGMDMQFVEGGLDKLVISLTTQIPLGTTGLAITEMTGGVEDFSSDNFKIMASVDIETGISVPVLGSPIKINDFGVKIAPTTQFEGSGELEIFGSKTADTKLSYDVEKSMIELSGNVNIGDVLIGKMDASLKSGSFTGKINGTMQTPAKLPWGFGWAANRKLSDVEAQIEDKTIQAQGQIWKITLAQKMEFGKETFPYFHYSLGRNYSSLYQVWKGSKASNFGIALNVGQALVVAGNDSELIDFSVTSPSGIVFDASNTEYEKFESSKQTIMILDNPESGTWSVNTNGVSDFNLEVLVLNPAPSVKFMQPIEQNSLTDSIVFSYFDVGDTLSIEVFIDDDQEGYDGSYYTSYGLYEYLNDGIARIQWNKKLSGGGWREVPNGEYFVYVKIDDNNNAPLYQYAPGSFLVQNYDFNEVPKNLTANQDYDSILVQWDALQDTSFYTTVHYKSISSGDEKIVTVVDSNYTYLKNIEYGMEYEIFATYQDPFYLFEGQKSNSAYVIFADSVNNNPPYFGANNLEWLFIEGENKSYEIEANDADGDNLSFEIVTGVTGIEITGGMITWNPSVDMAGVHEIVLSVSDGTETDTLVKNVLAFSQEQIAIKLSFNVSSIYDNSYNIISLYNYWSNSITEQVKLTNKRTNEEEDLTLSYTFNNLYTSQFNISAVSESLFDVQEGDTIIATYIYNEETYTAQTVYVPTIESGTALLVSNIENKFYKIYPNPTHGKLNMEFIQNDLRDYNIKVYDNVGKLVLKENTEGDATKTLDLGRLKKGMYFVKIQSGTNTQTSKIIVL